MHSTDGSVRRFYIRYRRAVAATAAASTNDACVRTLVLTSNASRRRHEQWHSRGKEYATLYAFCYVPAWRFSAFSPLCISSCIYALRALPLTRALLAHTYFHTASTISLRHFYMPTRQTSGGAQRALSPSCLRTSTSTSDLHMRIPTYGSLFSSCMVEGKKTGMHGAASYLVDGA